MKRKTFQTYRILFFSLGFMIYLSYGCHAQENAQWPFNIAFEDATGAKDTLWMVYDTAAVYPDGVNPDLGEEPLTQDDTNGFHVWCYLFFGEENVKYSTFALPPAYFFHEIYIYADNYELPITATWDTTLFTADILYETGDPVNQAELDNSYFFLVNNGWYHVYDMTIDNQANMPYFEWGGTHFPLFVDIERGPLDGDVGINGVEESGFSIFPNPASDYITLTFPKVVTADVRIYNATGKLVKSTTIAGSQKHLNLADLESGLYFVELNDEDGRLVKKIVVDR